MPCSECSRADDRVLGDHLVDPEVLADVAQEVDRRHRRGPVQVVDHHARRCRPRRTGTARSAPGCSPPRRRPSPWCSACARRVGLGSPISPVEPPTSASGRWPACCSRRAVSTWTRCPWCRLGAVGSKPHVEGDRARVQGLAQGAEVGAQRDQAAPLQVVEELVALVVTPPACRTAPVPAATRYRRPVRRHARLAGEPEPPRRAPRRRPRRPTRGPVRTSRVGRGRRRRRHGERRPPDRSRRRRRRPPVDPERDGEAGRPAGQVTR